jgi:hypothetical protein
MRSWGWRRRLARVPSCAESPHPLPFPRFGGRGTASLLRTNVALRRSCPHPLPFPRFGGRGTASLLRTNVALRRFCPHPLPFPRFGGRGTASLFRINVALRRTDGHGHGHGHGPRTTRFSSASLLRTNVALRRFCPHPLPFPRFGGRGTASLLRTNVALPVPNGRRWPRFSPSAKDRRILRLPIRGTNIQEDA